MFDKILKSKVWRVLGQFLNTVLVLLGLPILGWGLNALPEFFANPVRAAFAALVFAQALINAWLAGITPPEPGHKHHFGLARWHSYMFEAIAVLAAFGDRRGTLAWGQADVIRWIGLAIYLGGVGLAIWTELSWIKHLQREGARAFKHPVLIYDGPYKSIRYPSFLSLILYSLAFALLFRSWVGLILMVPLLGGIVNRIDDLERTFAEEHKKVWGLRCLNSKRLIPYLY